MMFRNTLAALALAGACSFAAAQPAIKVVTVDMSRLLKDYYKSAEAVNKLQDAGKKAQDQMEQMQKQLQDLVNQYKEMDEQSKSLLLSEDARNKATEDSKSKMDEIQRKDAEMKSFGANTQRALEQRRSTTIQLLLGEIDKVAVDIAKKHGATLFLDTSGPSQPGISAVLYSDPAYDITDEVLKEINKDAPPPAPATAPATPETPAPEATPKP